MNFNQLTHPYRSIACASYDLFEASVVRHRLVRLVKIDGTTIEGHVQDVFARGKEEFCRFHPSGANDSFELRLDSIREIIDLVDGTRTMTSSC